MSSLGFGKNVQLREKIPFAKNVHLGHFFWKNVQLRKKFTFGKNVQLMKKNSCLGKKIPFGKKCPA